ncbi:MAG TPA: SOS response-associated peptidase [Thermoanaerobaculia bacterium]|jgi:putative SOS response-associated peptidase YedK|nr:SOS response-associated peptidase [Thermoanaerobaculia bacterium]
MCGRYTLSSPSDDIALLFDLPEMPELPPRYNLAPTQEAAVVRVPPSGGPRQLDLLRWGLIPYWAKEAAIGNRMINARAESVADKPAYSWSFRKKRCLVPTDGFYEWKKEGKAKQPFLIHRQDGKPFAFAGLWSGWRNPETGEILRTFTILTTDANDLMRPLHDRMPVIIDPENFDLWLDPKVEEPALLQRLLLPHAVDSFEAYPVSRVVNSPFHDEPDCIAPLAVD